jgi:hypothetical protein
MRALSVTLASALLLIACDDPSRPDGLAVSHSEALTMAPAEVAGVLRLVNDCAYTADRLKADAHITWASAHFITASRDGADERCGTSDDRPYDSLAGLDAVHLVGDATLRGLLAHARRLGLVEEGPGEPVGSFDGVLFTEAEGRGALVLANTATAPRLDVQVGLDARAVNAIFAARPFRTDDVVQGLIALSSVPYVGASALEALKLHGTPAAGPAPEPAPAGCADLGGEFSGVTFTGTQAHDAVDLVTRGASDDLQSVSGVGPVLAERIIALRPFRTLTDLDAVGGVGPSMLKAILEALPGWCASASARCGCEGPPAAAVGVTLDGVVFDAEAAANALDILNRASREQMLADGHIPLRFAGLAIGLRPLASLALFSELPSVGPSAMGLLRDYARSGLWEGPGPMRTAVTIREILADLPAHRGTFVSMERVLVTRTYAVDGQYRLVLADDARAPTLTLSIYLCGHDSCEPPPDIRAGQWVRVVSAGLRATDRPYLSSNSDTLVTVLP